MSSRSTRSAATACDVTALLRPWQEWIRKKSARLEVTARDGFPLFESDPLARVHRMLNAFLHELPNGIDPRNIQVKKFATGRELLKLAAEQQLQLLRALVVHRVLPTAWGAPIP